MKAKAVKKKLLLFLFVLLAALLLRTLVLQSYKSTTHYMSETLTDGDYFLVNKFIFGRTIPFTDIRFISLREPRRGDVIVFEYPEDPEKDFVMRVVGIPGDEVEGRNKSIYINGKPEYLSRAVHREEETIPRERNPRDNFGPVKVPVHALFVMGDNRDQSYDSRFWGCVGFGRIKGLVFFRYWSWDSKEKRVRWENIGKRID